MLNNLLIALIGLLLLTSCGQQDHHDASRDSELTFMLLDSLVADDMSIEEIMDSVHATLDSASLNSVEMQLEIAYTHIHLGYFEEAQRIMGRVQPRIPLNDTANTLMIKKLFSFLHFYLAEYQLSLDAMKRCEPYIDPSDSLELAKNLNNQSQCLLELKRFDEAMTNKRRALKLCPANEENYKKTIVKSIGIAHLDMHHTDSALHYFYNIVSGDPSIDYNGNDDVYLNIGLAYEQIGKYDSALYLYHMQEEYDNENGSKTSMDIPLLNQYVVYKKIGNDSMALHYLEKLYNYQDSIHKSNLVQNIKLMEEKFQDLQRVQEIQTLKFENAQAVLSRNVLVLVVLVLVAIAGLIFQFFRNRIKLNKQEHSRKLSELKHQAEVDSLHASMMAQEMERKRIAMDLHDGIGVMLNTAKFKLNRTLNQLPSSEELKEVAKTEKMLETAAQEVRRVSQNMMPTVLTKLGLEDALEDLADQVQNDTTLRVQFENKGKGRRYSEELELTFYRIAQELLQNALKHSKAQLVKLRFTELPDHIELVYEDDGVGFDPEKWKGKSTGMESLRSRAKFVHGTLNFTTEPGKGTRVIVSAPYGEKEDV